jgi:hypothetical protein
MRFWGLEFLGSIHQENIRMRFSLMRMGRELTCERFGPWISNRPTSPPNPSRPLLFPLECSRPPFSHLLGRPLSLSFFPRAAATTTQNPSPPPPSPRCTLPLGSPSCGCELSIGVWREEEGRRNGRTQGEFVIIFCFLCATIKLIMCLSMRIGRGAVQKFYPEILWVGEQQ